MTRLPFDRALEVVLAHEGRYVDDPRDRGGATNFGISLRFLRSLGELAGDIDGDGDVDADDIRAIDRRAAGALYRAKFWDRYQYGEIQDPEIAIKVFDLAVNMGPGGAHKVLQRALRAVGIRVKDDGILGPKTRSAVVAAYGRGLIGPIRSEAAGYYRSLVAARPSLERYLTGWLNRAYS